MAKLKIPDRYQPGIRAILALDDATVDRLVQALGTASHIASLSDVSSSILSDIPGLPASDLDAILSTLRALYSLRSRMELSPDDLADAISQAIPREGLEGYETPPSGTECTKNRLGKLLGVEPLGIAIKSQELSVDHERRFCSARILTDIRPVFGASPSERPVHAIVTHMLKIDYHEGDALKEIFVALGKEDIEDLRRTLDRAEMKAESLIALLESVAISHSTL